MKRITGFCLSLLFIALLAMACDNSAAGFMPVENGKVEVSFGLESSNARTALPTPIESGWTYVLKGGLSGSTQEELGSWTDLTEASLQLDQGDWNFTLSVMDNADEIYVSQLADVSLSSAPVYLVFTLTPRNTGVGKLDIKINVPAQVDHIGIVDPESEDDTVNYYPVDGVVSIQEELAAGSYVFAFHVRNDIPRNIAQFTEVFIIRDKLTTSFTKTITEDELNTAPAAPSEFTYTVVDETLGAYKVQFSWKDNADNETSYWVKNGTRGITYGLADEESCSYTFSKGGNYILGLEAGNLAGITVCADTVSFSVPNGLAFQMNGGEDADGNSVKASENVNFGDDYIVPDAAGFAKKQDGISMSLVEWQGSDGKTYQVGDSVAAADLASASGCFYLKAIWSTEVIGARGPAGGIVFYDDEADGIDHIPGVRYLEYAPESVSNIWSNVADTSPIENGTLEKYPYDYDLNKIILGSGYNNTIQIVNQEGFTDGIALDCLNYSTSVNGQVYSDWFLPSWYEIKLIYSGGPGFPDNDYYWASSEEDPANAVIAKNGLNSPSNAPKAIMDRPARPIRGFNAVGEQTYTVAYIANGAEGYLYDNAFYTSGDTVTLAAIDGVLTPPAGLVFAGWVDANDNVYEAGDSITIASDNVVLTAQWAVAVTYDGNGTGITDIEDLILNFSAPHDYTVIGASTYQLSSGELKNVVWSLDSADATVSPVYNGDSIQISAGTTLYAHLEDFAVGAAGPAGGYIFYDKGSFSDGWRYLEAGPTDLGTDMWYTGSLHGLVTGAVDSSIGAGKANTELIAAIELETYELKMPVACYNYSLNNNGVTYDDWFMPSSNEMLEMYTALIANGIGNFTGAYYWTSTEYSQRDAFTLEVGAGRIIYNNINAVKRRNTPDTRPARMF